MVGAQRDYPRSTPISTPPAAKPTLGLNKAPPLQGAGNARIHDERTTESNRRGCNRRRHRFSCAFAYRLRVLIERRCLVKSMLMSGMGVPVVNPTAGG